MDLFWLILKWSALGIGIVALAGFVYFYFIKFAHPPQVEKAADLNDERWHSVAMKDDTLCSDGSPYEIYVRKAKSKNLMIYFGGGGACWDGSSASKPINLLSVLDGSSRKLKSFYFPKLQWFYPTAMGGMGDAKDSNNAFADWNIVFIPYCTGDMHIGDITNVYTFNGKKITVHHRGRINSLAALDWVFDNFNDPGKIMVAGESTGAFASAFYAPMVADHYPTQHIHCLSDAAMLSSGRWKEIVDAIWNSGSGKNLGFKIRKDIFEDALINRTDQRKRKIKYLHSNTVYDEVFIKFSAVLDHKSIANNVFIDQWSAATKASMKRLSNSDIDYNYFLTDWGLNARRHATPHTIASNDLYHKCTADGISYSQWLKRNVIDGEDLSLGRALLEKLP